MSAKYIFVTGGVVSSLGKGLAAASIGMPAGEPRFARKPDEVRPLPQRRSGTLFPFPARRSVRDG